MPHRRPSVDRPTDVNDRHVVSGHVKFIRHSAFWGVIELDDRRRVFFHERAVVGGRTVFDQLYEGQLVGCDVARNDHGWVAIEVRR